LVSREELLGCRDFVACDHKHIFEGEEEEAEGVKGCLVYRYKADAVRTGKSVENTNVKSEICFLGVQKVKP
jgi:hypothetical protein